MKRGWRIRGSWTDLVIPMPFTTVYLVTGNPVDVPADGNRDQLDHYVDVAQQAMDQLNAEADQTFASKSGSEFVSYKNKAA